MESTYDIFISYRRDGGAQYARILQLMLSQRGYRVFLDYDELKDGVFGKRIKAAIKDAPVFMLVLSKDSLDRCKNEDDWVREEILYAIEHQKKIVPVNPDKAFDGIHEAIPEAISSITDIQNSEIDFGQALGVTVDLMISNRLKPVFGKRSVNSQKDEDINAAKITLRKIDERNRFVRRLCVGVSIFVVVMVMVSCLLYWQHPSQRESAEREKVTLEEQRTELERKYKGFGLVLSPHLSHQQMNTVDYILKNMVCVKDNLLWVSKFEFSVGEWYGLLGGEYKDEQKFLPMTEISYGEVCMTLLDSLRNMTNIGGFDLPSVDEWQYAAQGGKYNETTRFAGSNDIEKVAWYANNSGDKVHPSDGQQGKEPNMLDLYDMSGNVSEMCNSTFGTPVSGSMKWTLCGGDFKSPANQVTATSTKGFDTDEKSPTIGFRLIIRTEE